MKLKKLICISTTLVLLCAVLMGCSNEKRILGTWQLQTEEGKDAGITLTFNDDGTLNYDLDTSVEVDTDTVAEVIDSGLVKDILELMGMTSEDYSNIAETMQKIIEKMDGLLTMEYELGDEGGKIEIESRLIGGFLKKTMTVDYDIDIFGNTLTYDGRTYKKLK